MSMNWRHYFLIVVIFVVGYVFVRFYPQLGNAAGLP